MTTAFPRLLTAEAMALLPLARMLVAKVQMKHWRGSLGAIDAKTISVGDGDANDADPVFMDALCIARHVERAADRLPFETKCLPRAMALQWMLRRREIATRLVIARSVTRRDSDEWHAWVERGGEMLIGHCDPSDYLPVLAFNSRSPVQPAVWD